MNLEPLIQFGLSTNEARIYVALLKLKAAKASEITTISGLKRSTVYACLDTLKNKGLASISNNDAGILTFSALPLSHVKKLLLEEKKNIDRQVAEVESLAMEISKSSATATPKVQSFHGKEGITALLNMTLDSGKSKISIIGEYSDSGDPIPWYTKQRVEKKISAELITLDTKKNYAEVADDSQQHRKTYFLQEKTSFPASIHISENEVVMFTKETTGPVGVLIEDASIAKTLQSIFELLRNQC